MESELCVGIIAGVSAILGSGVGAFASYKAAKLGFNAKHLRGELRSALQNILIFHELEKSYADALAQMKDKTMHAIKKKYRAKIKDAGIGVLTENSEPARVRKSLERLTDSD